MKKLALHELGRMDLAAYKQCQKIPLIVVLDNIRSQQNVGSIFRTSDAYRVEAIYLCGITATPPHREIHRSALGATDSVEWQYFRESREAIDALKQTGHLVYGIEQTRDSQLINTFRIPVKKPVAVVFGNEVHGLSEDILPLLDGALELPQYGTKHSLNVSVCAGIVIWELFQQFFEQ